MLENRENPSPEELDGAIAAAREAMPAYADLLAFYGRVFREQVNSVDQVHLKPGGIDPSRVKIAQREGFPLTTPADLPVDLAHGAALLARLCQAVQGATAPLEAASTSIQSALAEKRLDPQVLLAARRDSNPARFEALAADLNIPVEVLAFFADQSLIPSRMAGRRQLVAGLNDDEVRDKGYCPVCGSAPALGVLEEDGRRFLLCGLCRQRWAVPRVRCVGCGQTDAEKLYYIYSDEEPAYRIDACDACRHYVKTVDRRRLARLFYPPLEQVLTVHLDLVAAEKDLSPVPGVNWPA